MEEFMKRMRWEVMFLLNPKPTKPNHEDRKIGLIQKIEFKNKPNDFQERLNKT